jgi:hypothetical protein
VSTDEPALASPRCRFSRDAEASGELAGSTFDEGEVIRTAPHQRVSAKRDVR